MLHLSLNGVSSATPVGRHGLCQHFESGWLVCIPSQVSLLNSLLEEELSALLLYLKIWLKG